LQQFINKENTDIVEEIEQFNIIDIKQTTEENGSIETEEQVKTD
jgi:hypothetical protein